MKPCGNNQEKPFCQELFQTVVLLKHVECVTVYVPKYRVKIVWSVIFVSDAMRPDIYYPFHNCISHAAGYRVPLASNEIIDENGNIVTAGLDIFYVLTTFCWFPI